MAEGVSYIYALVDPRDGEIRYVGKTNYPGARRQAHLDEARNKKPNTHRLKWIRSLTGQGIKPEMLILEECLQGNWEEAEIWWIARLKEFGCKLTNTLVGGRGSSDPTGAIGKKIGEANRRRVWSEESLRKLKNRPLMTKDALRKLSERTIKQNEERVWTDSSRKKLSLSHRARVRHRKAGHVGSYKQCESCYLNHLKLIVHG